MIMAATYMAHVQIRVDRCQNMTKDTGQLMEFANVMRTEVATQGFEVEDQIFSISTGSDQQYKTR